MVGTVMPQALAIIRVVTRSKPSRVKSSVEISMISASAVSPRLRSAEAGGSFSLAINPSSAADAALDGRIARYLKPHSGRRDVAGPSAGDESDAPGVKRKGSRRPPARERKRLLTPRVG